MGKITHFLTHNMLVMAAVTVLSFSGLAYGATNASVFDQSGGVMRPAATELQEWPRKVNPVHLLVVFTKFQGEAPGDSLAPYWADQIFRNEPPSVSHFFDTVSFGLYDVTGEYLPRRYELPHDSLYYVENKPHYATDVIDALNNDPSVDLSLFDNDGPDGIPASHDDDGYVDYLILMPMTRPYDFISEYATGFSTLMMTRTVFADDVNYQNFFIKIDTNSGSIAVANSLNEAIGTIVAELSHAYGAEDLMDKDYDTGAWATDSAGVGDWDFLGRGALGWNGSNGPAGPCAYNRMKMNSIGYKNENLVDIQGFHEGLRLKDVGDPEGKVYRIWISSDEYFLIEHRQSREDGFYYDRNVPRSGLMILHVDTKPYTNNDEFRKLCDIEAPDGRYENYGYPRGTKPNALEGGDNLDFWAHDSQYTKLHYGNTGDAGDVYDGVEYTSFGANTNPNSFSNATKSSSGVEIFNIRREGDEMVFDVIAPPFHNWFEEQFPFIGSGSHRFSSSSRETFAPVDKKVLYLVTPDTSSRPQQVMVLDGDNLTIEDVSQLSSHNVDVLVTNMLFPGVGGSTASRVVRSAASVEELELLLDEFGAAEAKIQLSGQSAYVQKITLDSTDIEKPAQIRLLPNFPNPFNAETSIPFYLAEPGPVTLEVYNILGQKVIFSDHGYRQPGMHVINLDAGNLASGVYFYRLNGRVVSAPHKFNLIR